MTHDATFWTSDHRYEELARDYDQQVERTSPTVVTSRRQCPCLDYVHECGWAATSVTYYEYRGPAV